MKILVLTIAHAGDDARIVHRQVRSLLEKSHHVTLLAPEPSSGRSKDPEGLERISVRRAVGRSRLAAWLDARGKLRSFRESADLVLVHDPELLPIVGLMRWTKATLVWDVHEDFESSVTDREWIPPKLRPLVARLVRLTERLVQRRFHVLVAESSYQSRFPGSPVVPNSTWIPDEVNTSRRADQIVYVGRISLGRGVLSLIAVAEELGRRKGPRLVLVGPVDPDAEALIIDATSNGLLDWRGSIPNPEAMAIVSESVAGLSLLANLPNYVHSRPTKVIEYMAHGTPAITTPLPLASEMIIKSGSGVVTSTFDGPDLVRDVVDAVMAFASSPALRNEHGLAGWRFVHDHFSWDVDGLVFVNVIEELANTRSECSRHSEKTTRRSANRGSQF